MTDYRVLLEAYSKKKHREFVMKLAEEVLDREPKEDELENLGRVPWDCSSSEATELMLPLIAALEFYTHLEFYDDEGDVAKTALNTLKEKLNG